MGLDFFICGMKRFQSCVFQLCDPLLPVASRGNLVVVESVQRQLQKTVQETQCGNETTTLGASVLRNHFLSTEAPRKGCP